MNTLNLLIILGVAVAVLLINTVKLMFGKGEAGQLDFSYQEVPMKYDVDKLEYFTFVTGNQGYRKFTGQSKQEVAAEARRYIER